MKNIDFIEFNDNFRQILNTWHLQEEEIGHDGFGKFITPSGVLLGDYIEFIQDNIKDIKCKLAKDGEDIVGFVCYIKNKGSLFIECMGVNPKSRGQGYSSAILNMLKIECASMGLRNITLNVHKNNTSGIRSFLKVGKMVESSSENYLDFEIE